MSDAARRAGLLLAAISVVAQTPGAVRFVGEAPPPSSALSLWYRAPAADRPLTPRPTGPDAAAEWVRALPVGNGRLGAMVFGGVVHERLQLNEDTLWAGRPYDPVNPDAKAALPEVRRLLTESRYGDAAALASKSVMAKPLAQMPYQTLGDLGLTFAPVDVVERYRRDLDLSTATAHVSYTTGGVTFDREVFASAPDQVIVVRLTASRPGQISFEARLHTPQRATVEATSGRRPRDARRQRRRPGRDRGRTADDRRAAVRVARARPDDRRDPHRRRRRHRRARSRRRDAADRGGDELPALRRRQRRSRRRGGRHAGSRGRQDRRRAARRARP